MWQGSETALSQIYQEINFDLQFLRERCLSRLIMGIKDQ